MSGPDLTISRTHSEFALPLVIAVTGHRDLVAAEVPAIRQRVEDWLRDLAGRNPDRRLSVMSPLAEGADRLIAEVALEIGIDLVVPLPMARNLYKQDFVTNDSARQFESLCDQANEVFEMPLARGTTEEQLLFPGTPRNRQYAQVGVFLCAHCHILLAIWDGKSSTDLGGTGQVVSFHHDDIMPGTPAKHSRRNRCWWTMKATLCITSFAPGIGRMAIHIRCPSRLFVRIEFIAIFLRVSLASQHD